MATAYMEYLKERDSHAVGPLVFRWFITNPGEHPEGRFCWDSREGCYLAGLLNEASWERDPDRASEHWIVVTDDRGRLLVKHDVGGADWASRVMVLVRGFGGEIENVLGVLDYCRWARTQGPGRPRSPGGER